MSESFQYKARAATATAPLDPLASAEQPVLQGETRHPLIDDAVIHHGQAWATINGLSLILIYFGIGWGIMRVLGMVFGRSQGVMEHGIGIFRAFDNFPGKSDNRSALVTCLVVCGPILAGWLLSEMIN